jgi:hypothetical protein
MLRVDQLQIACEVQMYLIPCGVLVSYAIIERMIFRQTGEVVASRYRLESTACISTLCASKQI